MMRAQGAASCEGTTRPLVLIQMQEAPEQKQLPLEAEQLGVGGFLRELIHGIGEMAGLGLLWTLEAVRNVWFKTLDRLNIKARPSRRVSAFPPGSPRRHKTV
jgi:hypothetical protein